MRWMPPFSELRCPYCNAPAELKRDPDVRIRFRYECSAKCGGVTDTVVWIKRK